MNAELNIEQGVSYKTIMRSVGYTDTEEYRGVIFPAETMMAIRLMKDDKTGKERVTTLYILLGGFDDSGEVKTQSEDVDEFNTKIDAYLAKHVFTPGTKQEHGIESVYDIEQKAINEDHAVRALDLQIEVSQSTIDAYDILCGVV